ncbi:uncharacterized protein LOC144126209 [Amblyomma americanum]
MKVEGGRRDEARTRVVSILAKRPTRQASHMLPEERNAIRSLRRNREIVILPADKANATVILNSTDYDKKMMELLKRQEHHKALYYRILCHNGSAPALYGLPKIHKEGVPMRPRVDFTRSPLCQLSGYLHRVFAPLVGKGPTFIRNSFDFTEKVRDAVVEDDDIIVSFDVTSLFTSVPVDLAVDVCAAALQNDEKLSERTPLEAQDLLRLLKFCLKNTYFVFRGSFYKQVHGTAMGASISVTAANLTMEAIENRALASFHPRPNVFLWYIDDCFCIVKKDALAAFTRHINSMEKAIQFTVEEEWFDKLSHNGWTLSQLQYPSGFHLCVMLPHVAENVTNQFVSDLNECNVTSCGRAFRLSSSGRKKE